MRRSTGTVIVLAVLFAATSAGAETILVPKHHETIQAAVDAAAPGDVIKVSKRTYPETVRIAGFDGFTLLGMGRPVVEGAGSDGIVIDGSKNVLVKGFSVRDTARHGIVVTGSSDVTVEKCVIENIAVDGVHTADSKRITIRKLRITDCDVDGISLSGSDEVEEKPTDDSLVEKVKIFDCIDDGIEVNGSRNRLSKVKLGDILDDGILFIAEVDPSEGNVVERCKAKGCGDNGFDSDGNRNSFSRCTALATKDAGIQLDGNGNSALRCKSIRTGVAGISVWGADNLIEGNRVVRAEDDGLFAAESATGNRFLSNRIAKSGGLDVRDLAAKDANTYEGNRFRTSNLE